MNVNRMRMAKAHLQTHSELNMAILSEKVVAEQIDKLMSVKGSAQRAWIKYAEVEQNAVLNNMLLKMSQMDEMYFKIHQDYSKEYERFRRVFKHVVKGEKMVDEISKQAEQQAIKMNKLQKQADEQKAKAVGKKASDKQDKKLEAAQLELARAISATDNICLDYQTQKHNQEIFKYTKVREAWRILLLGQKRLFEHSLMLNEAQDNILDLYTIHNYDKMDVKAIGQADCESTALISSVAEGIGMPVPQPPQAVRGRTAMPDRTTVPGEPGGHDLDYQPAYVAVPMRENQSPQMSPHEDTSSDTSSPAISRENSKEKQRPMSRENSRTMARPLPPIPPENVGEDTGEDVYYSAVAKDTGDQTYANVTPGSKHSTASSQSYVNMQMGDEGGLHTYDDAHIPSPDIDAGDSVYYFLDGSKSVQGSKPTSPQTPGPNVNDIYELDGDG